MKFEISSKNFEEEILFWLGDHSGFVALKYSATRRGLHITLIFMRGDDRPDLRLTLLS